MIALTQKIHCTTGCWLQKGLNLNENVDLEWLNDLELVWKPDKTIGYCVFSPSSAVAECHPAPRYAYAWVKICRMLEMGASIVMGVPQNGWFIRVLKEKKY